MLKSTIAALLGTLVASTTFAATGDILVQLKQNNTRGLTRVLSSQDQLEAIFPSLNLYMVKPASVRSSADLLRSLNTNPDVKLAFADYKVQQRGSIAPNDINFEKQWSLNPNAPVNIKATEAWEVSKGGPNAIGEDVVIALVDGGFDITHEDIVENLWINKNEVAGNGVDDDNNGYIDDVYGWNGGSNTGNITDNYHGTHVAGIAGARGNNNKGVSGINWETKLMMVVGSSGDFSVVGKAYNYVLTQKKLFLSSKGLKGANVVATNSSFGVDYADCTSAQFKVWNDMYNKMGEAGILSAAATANLAIDVDVKGDVPTGCDSPYIVSVTNTDKTDKINGGAAWGLKSVDIGAPGTAIYSTLSKGKYGELTGTSMATPHIAGTIGLMQSAASADFATFYRTNPAQGALKLKEILLSTTDENATLKGRTVSNGRLNLAKAVKAIHAYK